MDRATLNYVFSILDNKRKEFRPHSNDPVEIASVEVLDDIISTIEDAILVSMYEKEQEELAADKKRLDWQPLPYIKKCELAAAHQKKSEEKTNEQGC